MSRGGFYLQSDPLFVLYRKPDISSGVWPHVSFTCVAGAQITARLFIVDVHHAMVSLNLCLTLVLVST